MQLRTIAWFYYAQKVIWKFYFFEFEGEERTTASFVQGTEGGVKYIKIGGVQYNVVE